MFNWVEVTVIKAVLPFSFVLTCVVVNTTLELGVGVVDVVGLVGVGEVGLAVEDGVVDVVSVLGGGVLVVEVSGVDVGDGVVVS